MTNTNIIVCCSLGLLAMSYHLVIVMVIVLLGLAYEGRDITLGKLLLCRHAHAATIGTACAGACSLSQVAYLPHFRVVLLLVVQLWILKILLRLLTTLLLKLVVWGGSRHVGC